MNVIVPDTHNAYASQAKTKILIKYKKPLPINPVPRQDGGEGGAGGGVEISSCSNVRIQSVLRTSKSRVRITSSLVLVIFSAARDSSRQSFVITESSPR